jgi:polyisoprenoid-binding protein YceI
MGGNLMAVADAGVREGLVTWNVDPTHSHVEFAIRHLMITTVKGLFTDVKGTVKSDGSDPAKGHVSVTIGVTSIDTREPQRDAHLRSADFFDADKFPTITFNSRNIRDVMLDVTSGGRAKDPWGGERAGFTASGKINRSDFGLTWNQALETGGVLVGDEVKISIDVELIKAA